MKRINVTETFLPPRAEYEQLIASLWESKWLTNRGLIVCNLENEIQRYLGSSAKPLVVNNGTIALQIPMKAYQLTGEIITTPFSYVATTSTIVWENCTPVFVDIHPEYLTIDESQIEAAITERTTAILAVHVYGNPCEVEVIEAIAKKHKLKVIYDAAHCFGVKYKGRSLFDFGDISTCSFHATKLFHTGEGGAIFCNDPAWTETIYYHHNFGHNGPEVFHGLGVNAKVNELNAAMGMAVLPYMSTIISARKEVTEYYDAALQWKRIRKVALRPDTEYNYAYYPIIFENEELLLKAVVALNALEIYPRRYFYPSLNTIGYTGSQIMPVSESVSACVLCLPLFVGLEKSDLERICNTLNACLC